MLLAAPNWEKIHHISHEENFGDSAIESSAIHFQDPVRNAGVGIMILVDE